MTDESKSAPAEAPAAEAAGPAGAQSDVDWQSIQKNLAERLFPGPTRQVSPQVQKRIEHLLRPLDPNDPTDWRNKRRGGGADGTQAGQATQTSQAPVLQAETAPAAATADDMTQLHEALTKQNELLQAILSTQVDTQTDSRSTAQNSRTFAWAGSVIAILTLVATVISVVAAVQGH